MEKITNKFLNEKLALLFIILGAIVVRIHYLTSLVGDVYLPNLGGDPCHHFNIALNIALGKGAVTNFIYSYWFHHSSLPAVTDVYPPGAHAYIALFLKAFGKNYFVARIAILIASILTIYLGYKIGKIIGGKKIGIISALFIAFNDSHIENSVMVMTPVITLLALQLFVLCLLESKKIKYLIAAGLSLGWASLCQNGAIILYPLAILYIWLLFDSKKERAISIFLFTTFFIAILMPWSLKTYAYFGSPLYSNMKYYPFTNSFMNMMSEASPPSKNLFMENIVYGQYLKHLALLLFENTARGIKYLTPTFIIFLAPILPFIFLFSFKSKVTRRNLLFLSSMALIIFIPFVIATTTAMNGRLFARHYIIFLAFLPPIFSIGIMYLYEKLNINWPLFKIKMNIKYSLLFFTAITIIIIFINEFKSSPWSQDNKNLYAIGNDIRKLTDEKSVIMYAYTPQDAWCLTGRNIISDPVFGFYKTPSLRAKEESDNFNANYLLIDQDDQIYKRSEVVFSELLYKDLILKKIYTAPSNNIFLYEIIKK